MESPLIAQLLGLYFIIVAVLVLVRRRSIMPAVSDLAENRPLLFVVALVELAAGLALILTQPSILESWMGIMSVIGWMLVIEAIIYLALPARKVQKFIKRFNKREWYLGGGIVALALGAALAGYGFGFF